MSDDILELEFKPTKTPLTSQMVLDVGPNNLIFAADEVILFSGGLDSLSGAFDRLVF